MVEESLKALPLLFFLRKKSYPVTVFIAYCALASGVGFSIQESIFYFSMSEGGLGDIFTLVIRSLTTALMHGMSTAIVGMGLLLLQNQRHILLPVTFGLLALGMIIHALFNLLLPTRFTFIAMLMPISLYISGLIFLEDLREKKEKGMNLYEP
jgi:RsiW-degrading membrane proteinase PrsW (M82 family)